MVVPVLLAGTLRSAVPPLLPLDASHARKVRAVELLPCQLLAG